MRDVIVGQFKCVANIFGDDFGKDGKDGNGIVVGGLCDPTGKIV